MTTAELETPPPGAALLRQSRTELVAVLVGRTLAVGQLLAAVPGLSRRVRYPSVLALGATGIVGQSAWASRRLWRTRRVRDAAVGWSDVLACVGALVAEAGSWASRDLPPDPRWSLPLSVVVSSWLPFEIDPAQLGPAGIIWASVYLATTRNQSPARVVGTVAGQRLGELAAPPACGLFCQRFASHLRRQAEQLDEARAGAVAQASLLAQEEERNRQYRVAHDSAIQMLEAVAGGWNVGEEVLMARLNFELHRLERVLAGGSLVDGDSLPDALASVASELGLSGVEVALETGTLTRSCSLAVVQALADAAHEALVNVRKHSGAAKAEVRASDDGDGVLVTIADAGRGFDPSSPRTGFGMTESLERRVQSVGGRVEIRSARGIGSTVRLWAPAHDS